MRKQKIELIEYTNKFIDMSDEESVNKELMDSIFRHVDRVVKHKCVPDVSIDTREANRFIDELCESQDQAVLLEHGTVYLRFTPGNTKAHIYSELPESITSIGHDDLIYVTCSLYDVYKAGLLDDVTQFITSRSEYHSQRMTLKITLTYIDLLSMLTDKMIHICCVSILNDVDSKSRLSSKVSIALTGYIDDIRKIKILDTSQL